MKLRIDDYCIRCGACIDMHPGLFERNIDEQRIEVKYDVIPAEMEQEAILAAKNCALTAIKIRDWTEEKTSCGTMSEKYVVNAALCEGCAICAASCPGKCISLKDDESIFISSDGCLDCGSCVRNCPTNAIALTNALTPEEKMKPYAKYFYEPMAPVPPEKLAALAAPMDPSKALLIEDRAKLVEPGYSECEVGYCILPDGSGYLANLTKLPGITLEMFSWWTLWHSLEDLRYKIWDPDDHFYARALNRERVLDSSIPLHERIWGISHNILEDIGGGPDTLVIDFKSPAEFGYPAEKIGPEKGIVVFAGNGHSPVPGPKAIAAAMTHVVREVEGGVELRSRFWIGYQIINGHAVKVIPDGIRMPEVAPLGLLAHNMKEYTNLSVLLPKLYATEKDNWL